MSICVICAVVSDATFWIFCPKCKFGCCRQCVKKYLLMQTEPYAKCMSCQTRWSAEFIANNTDEKFHNQDYREHRAKIAFQREKSLFPATQEYVALIKDEDNVVTEMDEIQRKVDKLCAKLNKLQDKYHLIQGLKRGKIRENEKTEKKEKLRFLGHCPQQDCKGYLADEYICGLCKKKACRSCRLAEHDGQDCDPNVVETVKLLAKDTRGCPSCHIPITKITGCDQMFCLSCFTAFSWNTGKIETGRIHNPHYYEWVKKNNNGVIPREPGDVRCGGPVSANTLSTKIQPLGKQVQEFIMNCHRNIGHIRATIVPRYRPIAENNKNFDLRIKYMMNEVDDKRMISELKRRDKKQEKNEAILLVLTMYCDTVDDLNSNIVRSGNIQELKNAVRQILILQNYVNEQFENISKRFKNKTPLISDSGLLMDVGRKMNEQVYE